MASPKELDLLTHDKAAGKPGAPDLTAQGSFAATRGGDVLPVEGDAGGGDDDGGAAAEPGATASASLVHSTGLKHGIAEVLVVSAPSGLLPPRVLLRRRPADDPLAPDRWDVSATAHLLPEDAGDAEAAARRALRAAGLPSGVRLAPLPERRERLEFAVGGFVENVVVHGFTCAVDDEGGGGGGGGADAASSGAPAPPPPSGKGPDGAERTWIAKEDALRMLTEEPAVCSPFLLAGKKAWFAAT
jgi:hypothetical protein